LYALVFTYIAQRTANGRVKGQRYAITYEGGKVQWRRLIERAGIEDLRFHDIRHDVGTKLARETGNLAVVQKALNHSSKATTLRYIHATKSDLSKAMEKFQGAIGDVPKKLPKTTKEVA
jgi:integrase